MEGGDILTVHRRQRSLPGSERTQSYDTYTGPVSRAAGCSAAGNARYAKYVVSRQLGGFVISYRLCYGVSYRSPDKIFRIRVTSYDHPTESIQTHSMHRPDPFSCPPSPPPIRAQSCPEKPYPAPERHTLPWAGASGAGGLTWPVCSAPRGSRTGRPAQEHDVPGTNQRSDASGGAGQTGARTQVGGSVQVRSGQVSGVRPGKIRRGCLGSCQFQLLNFKRTRISLSSFTE